MSYSEPPNAIDLRFTGVMIAIIIGSFAYLAFGPDLEIGFAGYGALLLLPFAFGALFTNLTGFFSWLGCLGAPLLLAIMSASLAALGMEGWICVAVATPPWIIAALGGGLTSLWLKRRERAELTENENSARLKVAALGIIPLMAIYVEEVAPPQWETRTVSRAVIVEASPEQVWPLLVTIPNIQQGEGIPTLTHDWLDVPRPSQASLIERAGHQVRIANWGDAVRFEEVITQLEPGQAIAWQFAFPDDSVQQHTDRHISPDGPILQIETGRYELIPLAGDRTKVELTTTYRMRSRLSWYFGWWGEKLLGDVQDNVLAIIAQRSDQAA